MFSYPGIILRQLQCPVSSTFTYILGCAKTRDAAIIDSVLSNVNRDSALARELDLRITLSLDTHVHADHITGASALRQVWGSKIGVSKLAGPEGADIYFEDGDVLSIGDVKLTCYSTPGHTNGCFTFYLPSVPAAFTGDALLIRGCGRTDFQQGSASALFKSIRERIFSFPDETILFVGHDYRGASVSTVAEEKKFNPRVGNEANENDFVIYMDNLNLPHPKQIAEAVPANMKCGAVPYPSASPFEDVKGTTTSPFNVTLAGYWEVDSHWLEENLSAHNDDVVVVDVRDADEIQTDLQFLGKIPGSVFIPLGSLATSSPATKDSSITVLVCRSGTRSAQGCVLLTKAGNKRVANLAGGLLRWNREGRVVEKE